MWPLLKLKRASHCCHSCRAPRSRQRPYIPHNLELQGDPEVSGIWSLARTLQCTQEPFESQGLHLLWGTEEVCHGGGVRISSTDPRHAVQASTVAPQEGSKAQRPRTWADALGCEPAVGRVGHSLRGCDFLIRQEAARFCWRTERCWQLACAQHPLAVGLQALCKHEVIP